MFKKKKKKIELTCLKKIKKKIKITALRIPM